MKKPDEVIGQPLSSVACDQISCKHCRWVSRNDKEEGFSKGRQCSKCGIKNDTNLFFYPTNIHMLVDLIQDAYHSQPLTERRDYIDARPHDVSVVIYFCTLREVLLSNVINNLIATENVSDAVHDRLMSDNKFHLQKQNQLFHSLAGDKWKEALGRAGNQDNVDYSALDKSIEMIARERNRFIHEGNSWSIDRKMATGCLNDHLLPLLRLYVTLNNMYVHPRYISGG